MIKGKTKSGFSWALDESRLDDYELLDYMVRTDSGDITAIHPFARGVLGEKQEEKLKEHLRKKNGKVGIRAMLAEVTEILNESAKGKNSQSSPE